jgi:hypothetical protein
MKIIISSDHPHEFIVQTLYLSVCFKQQIRTILIQALPFLFSFLVFNVFELGQLRFHLYIRILSEGRETQSLLFHVFFILTLD